MTEDRSDAEGFRTFLEEELTNKFGPPKSRTEKQKRYISMLVGSHSEPLIRAILVALSRVDDFISAGSLAGVDLRSVPLEEVVRPYDIPWFYFEAIREREDGSVRADVSHGISLAAKGETFVFTREEQGLKLVERRSRWIS